MTSTCPVITCASSINQTTADLQAAWQPEELPPNSGQHDGLAPPPQYRHPKKNWRLKRGALPQWYKRQAGIRGKAQSGAARVARFRPRRLGV